MGRHSVQRGEKSSYGNSNGSTDGSTPGYSGQHRATTDMDTKDKGPRDSRVSKNWLTKKK